MKNLVLAAAVALAVAALTSSANPEQSKKTLSSVARAKSDQSLALKRETKSRGAEVRSSAVQKVSIQPKSVDFVISSSGKAAVDPKKKEGADKPQIKAVDRFDPSGSVVVEGTVARQAPTSDELQEGSTQK